MSPIQNPPQTLEDVFARLCVFGSPFNDPPFNFVANGSSGITGASKISSCNGWGSGVIPTPQSSNLCNPYDDGFLHCDPLARQRENPALRRLRWFSDMRGMVLLLAKDHHESRTLQETLKMLTREEFSIIFLELISHVPELMVDSFGNYVVQRMVEICSEEQLNQIVLSVTQYNFQLVKICLISHGIRAVEKLLEHLTTQEQRSRVISALSPGAAVLAKDVNGHRALLHCLKHFSCEDNKHLLNMVAMKCFWIAIDKTGCCVLQQCLNNAQGGTKKNMIDAILFNASVLAEDRYGNYVVQHLLSLKIPGLAERLLRQLEGKFFYLSCNKYGSNVVEKFFLDSGGLCSAFIIFELLHNPNVRMLLVDPYGNYVIKSALLVSKGGVRNALERLIKLNSMIMQSNMYGKKLLAWFHRSKNINMDYSDFV
ncbi:pumilio homolog 12 [Cajanus cajan]|uniref:Pumilio isogenyy domain family member 4 n=1 Tax=Cajanus cajan TaxID=3821 RepID=A0A151TTT4_CAJCA|nr:pumilio homolog 12 [Cajanus cajan]KYP70470.1 Pumilio isogenyy domain family member 4 [Cajanus cajan]